MSGWQSMARGMRVLHPAPHIRAFYDGRGEGRLHGPQPNWLDDGGYTLGTCSYAIVSNGEALVYDTHMTLDHARAIRAALEAEGCRQIRVILSHHHLDHIAGNATFGDCEIWANAATAAAMEAERHAAETADPPINPVIMPSHMFETEHDTVVGAVTVLMRSFDIHSHDGLVLWLPETGELLAGDTLEDTCTYVAEPDRLTHHLSELERMKGLAPNRILPNHGAPDVIAGGGYPPSLISATQAYIEKLLKCPGDTVLSGQDLKTFVADEIAAGALIYEPAYEVVHQRNVAAVLSGSAR